MKFIVSLMVLLLTTGQWAQSSRRGVQQHPRERQMRIGTTAWSDNGCLHVWTRRGWALGEWCRQFPTGDVRLYDVWRSQDPQRRLVSQLNIGEPGWVTEYVYATRATWKYRLRNPADKYLWYNNGWVSEAQQVAELQRLINQLNALVAQQRAQGGQVPPAARAQSQALNDEIAKMRINQQLAEGRNVAIWVAPNCTSSYNGC